MNKKSSMTNNDAPFNLDIRTGSVAFQARASFLGLSLLVFALCNINLFIFATVAIVDVENRSKSGYFYPAEPQAPFPRLPGTRPRRDRREGR